MPVIQVLPPNIANQIAAGEVVERPSSVVKELVENAIDAGALGIVIEIENGGLDLIRVTDNGSGIPADSVETAFLRHATSKIQSANDLFSIGTLGFRGEALASIAAVSAITMTTRCEDAETGIRILLEDGAVRSKTSVGCAKGTCIEVTGLFANVPARFKFLKSSRTEAGYIADYLSRMMMARPDIAFLFRNNGKTVYQTYGDGKLLHVLLSIYGTGVSGHLGQVEFDDGYLKIFGYIGDAELSKPNRSHQSLYINGRYIRSYALSGALSNAFETRLMIGRFPFAVLHLTISPGDVDVNVHPTKMEVRFTDEMRVVRSVTAACADALARSVRLPVEERFTQTQLPVNQTPSSNQMHPFSQGQQDQINTFVLPPRVELRKPISQQHYVREKSGMPAHPVAKPMGSIGSVQRYAIENRKQEVIPRSSLVLEQVKLVDDPYTVVGCLFDTYWIVQQGEDIFLIDQHAAHERRNYEELMARKDALVSQKLLVPHSVSLEPLAYETLREYLEDILSLGYELSFSENYMVNLTAVPQINGRALPDQYLFDALHQLRQLGKTSDRQLIRSTLIQASCKHAIKAGERVDQREIEELIQYFQKEGAPLTCPHGRPIMVRLTRLEIEKMFKRVL